MFEHPMVHLPRSGHGAWGMFDTVGDGDADGQDDGDDDDDDDDDGDDYSMVSSGIQNKHGLPSGPLQQQFEVVFWPEVP